MGVFSGGMRSRNRRMIGAAALSLALVSGTAACSSSSGNSSSGGGTLKIAVAADFDLLDPHKAALETFLVFFPLVYDSLLSVDKNGDPAPGVAKSWTVAPDGLKYTFALRDDVTWHDGTKLTAADVKWNIDRILNPQTASIRAVYFSNVASVETPDDLTVVFTMKNRDASLLAYLATQGGTSLVYPKDIDASGAVKDHIGTGPFKWTSYKTGQLDVTRNDSYWNGAPKLDGVQLQVIKDPQARLQALVSGQVDYNYNLDPNDASSQANSGAFTMVENPQNRADYVSFNTRKKPFDDIRVRTALCMAINRNDLVKGAWNGYGKVTDQFFDEKSVWRSDTAPAIPADGDLDGAKKLLAEAGFTGFTGTITDAQGEPGLALETQTITSAWKALGVNLDTKTVDTPTFVKEVRGGNYDILHMFLGFIPDPGRPFELMTTASTGNAYFGFVANPETDQLIAAVRNATDVDSRKAAVQKVYESYTKARGTCLLATPKFYVGIGKKVKTFEQGAIYVKYTGGNDITKLTLS